jgi:uncharacterized repeat protein (TIGR02543 family)
MEMILRSRRNHYLAAGSIFAIMMALITGMAGCASSPIEYDLVISSTEGGVVTTPGEGTFVYDDGDVVDLVATPDASYVFVNWTGDVNTIEDVNDTITSITIDDNYSVTAHFALIAPTQYDLTVSSTVGGEVTNPGEGVFSYEEGTVISLVATSEAGYQFADWIGDVASIADVNDATTTIAMNGDYSITANFGEGDSVIFADPNLEAAIREAIGIPDRPIYPSDLEGLTSLSALEKGISDLAGLELCVDLTYLQLDLNQIGDISPLVQNEGLGGEGDAVYLRGNPLSWNSINVYIPEIRGRGATVIYDEQGITGNVTVVPNCEGMTAEYTITFDINASLTSGVHSITIWFPEGTTVPETGWQTGNVTVNGHDVFGVDVTAVDTRVTFLVPQHIASGTVTVVFKEDAGIVNPPAGSYYLYVNTSRAPDATPMRLGPY